LIALPKNTHQALTNAWRKAIPYGSDYLELGKDYILKQAKKVYKDFPEILEVLNLK